MDEIEKEFRIFAFMNETSCISVILPLKLEWEPCYYIPGNMDAGRISTGSRVKVKFANKTYSAVVSATGITPDTPSSKIKPIEDLEEGLEDILPEEIELWRKVSDYYMCSIGEVYKAAYPVSKINLEESHASAILRTQERREKLLAEMRRKVSRIQDRLTRKEELASRSREGTKARARYREEAEKIRLELNTAAEALKAAEARASSEKGADERGKEVKLRVPVLSKTQQEAYERISEAFNSRKPALLHGVTGSGKTEIYIKFALEALHQGRNVLYLVPEIALSRQLEDRLHEHFGDRLLIFHSAESAASRRDTAESVRNGNGYIVLGTRSSLFLPHHDLGLIIVDEEHDSSYKQDSPAPRYNGRDTALMLSLIQKCNILLGSATPSFEELYNCECGKHALVSLKERYHGSEDADVEIIDTRAERKKRGMNGSFSRKLISHIGRVLSEGGQVMILRSRRSWAPALQCEECGKIQECPHCHVSMSLHKGGQTNMVCHYCGHSSPYTGKCAQCGGQMKTLGAGTQKIEEEASALFPHARIARLDSDTAQNKSYEKRTIREFIAGETDILIGTQMLTKGFDIERLRLVAVISADTLLGMQDFRADEKALQILEQFRGRSGRREDKGLFVIQTSQPEHPVYRRICSGERMSFNSDLLLERKDFMFPPYTRIIEISAKDRYEDRVIRMSSRLAAVMQKHFEVTGPYSPAVDKIADHHIRAIRITLKKDRNLTVNKQKIMDIIRDFEKNGRYEGHLTVNVDPV